MLKLSTLIEQNRRAAVRAGHTTTDALLERMGDGRWYDSRELAGIGGTRFAARLHDAKGTKLIPGYECRPLAGTNRYEYRTVRKEDQRLSPYVAEWLLAWGASMNIQRCTGAAFMHYTAKYVAKPEHLATAVFLSQA
jgi:hypothetical protein